MSDIIATSLGLTFLILVATLVSRWDGWAHLTALLIPALCILPCAR